MPSSNVVSQLLLRRPYRRDLNVPPGGEAAGEVDGGGEVGVVGVDGVFARAGLAELEDVRVAVFGGAGEEASDGRRFELAGLGCCGFGGGEYQSPRLRR